MFLRKEQTVFSAWLVRLSWMHELTMQTITWKQPRWLCGLTTHCILLLFFCLVTQRYYQRNGLGESNWSSRPTPNVDIRLRYASTSSCNKTGRSERLSEKCDDGHFSKRALKTLVHTVDTFEYRDKCGLLWVCVFNYAFLLTHVTFIFVNLGTTYGQTGGKKTHVVTN